MDFDFYVCLNGLPHATNMLTGYLEPVAIAVHFRCLKTGVASGILFVLSMIHHIFGGMPSRIVLVAIGILIYLQESSPTRLENCQQAKELQRPTLPHHLLTTRTGAKVKQQEQQKLKFHILGTKRMFSLWQSSPTASLHPQLQTVWGEH